MAIVLVAGGCATARPSAVCRGFDPADFRPGRAGVAANGDLLVYSRPSIVCPPSRKD